MRMAFFSAALIACAPALAQTQTQSFSGTYTTKNPQGDTVTLTLKQDAKKAVTGTLTGNNNSFDYFQCVYCLNPSTTTVGNPQTFVAGSTAATTAGSGYGYYITSNARSWRFTATIN